MNPLLLIGLLAGGGLLLMGMYGGEGGTIPDAQDRQPGQWYPSTIAGIQVQGNCEALRVNSEVALLSWVEANQATYQGWTNLVAQGNVQGAMTALLEYMGCPYYAAMIVYRVDGSQVTVGELMAALAGAALAPQAHPAGLLFGLRY